MILRRDHLGRFPTVFRAITGLTVALFDAMLPQLLAAFAADRRRRLDRPGPLRAFGGGDDFDLAPADQFLLTVVWLRHYPTQEVLGYLFGVSDSSALRAMRRRLPLLEKAGKDTHADARPRPRSTQGPAGPAQGHARPGRGHRCLRAADSEAREATAGLLLRQEEAAYAQEPGGRGRGERQGRGRSGKRPRPTGADIKVLDESRLLPRLPEGVGAIGDLAYVGIADLRPSVAGATPRRKPRGKGRSAEDRRYNARSRVGGSWSNTASAGCAVSRR